MNGLREKTISGLVWNLLERVGLRVVQFLPTIILARLLTPEQFGLIGMLSIFIALAQTFLDSGFGVALIQKKDATYEDECSIFYFNILVGFVAVVVLYGFAPLAAAFYNQPLLTGLMRWLSLSIPIQAFSLIQTTLLTRRLDFKTQIKANLFATFLAGVIGVAAALYGLGVWSLVIQTVSNTTLQTITLWLMSDWRPALIFELDALKRLFGFGSRMLSSGLVATLFDNLYQVFIGKVFSAASLGYFTRATSLRSIVVDTTSYTLSRVMFPALASIQDDQERLKRAIQKTIRLTTFVHFPMMVGLIVVARPLFILLFSEQWLNSVLFFQLMCVSGIPYPLSLINLEILKVKGRSDLFFRLELIKRTLIILMIILTYRWGISAMLIGHIFTSAINYCLNGFYSAELISYSLKSQVLDVMPALAFSTLMGIGMFGIKQALQVENDLAIISIQSGIGILVYFAISAATKIEPFIEIIALRKQLPFFRMNS